MPRRKQQCGFRIPWISGSSTEPQSHPSKQKSKSPATNIPHHRPPFRPPGIASTPSQPPPHRTPRIEPQQLSNSLPPQSPTSSVIIDSPQSSPSESPSTPSNEDHSSKALHQNPLAEESTQPHSLPMKELELELDNAIENSEPTLEKQSKSYQAKSKTNYVKHRKSIPRLKTEPHTTTTITTAAAASASGVQTKDAFYTTAFQADKKKEEAKIMFAMSSPREEDIKLVTPASTSTNPVNRNVSTISLSNENNPITQNGIKDDVSTMNAKLPMDDKTVSVVTLAGDNRGVTMNVAGSHSHPTKTNREGKNTSKEKDEVGKTYVNSNIQSINNSIMSHGSINGRDPGVRVILPQQPQPDDNKQPSLENRRPEVTINRTERLPYRPVVRRRCLRGLFLEPSDSDPDNPDKPRRHGCKFSCGEIAKDKDAVTKI